MEVFIQICEALAHVHSKRILHRDIKVKNVFLTRDLAVRVGDFGSAKLLGERNDFVWSVIGTPYYLSPELVREERYGQKSDVWGLGCLLYYMCRKRVPFRADTEWALKRRITSGKGIYIVRWFCITVVWGIRLYIFCYMIVLAVSLM